MAAAAAAHEAPETRFLPNSACSRRLFGDFSSSRLEPPGDFVPNFHLWQANSIGGPLKIRPVQTRSQNSPKEGELA